MRNCSLPTVQYELDYSPRMKHCPLPLLLLLLMVVVM